MECYDRWIAAVTLQRKVAAQVDADVSEHLDLDAVNAAEDELDAAWRALPAPLSNEAWRIAYGIVRNALLCWNRRAIRRRVEEQAEAVRVGVMAVLARVPDIVRVTPSTSSRSLGVGAPTP